MKQLFAESFYFARNNINPIIKIMSPFVMLMVFVGVPINYYQEALGGPVWLYWVAVAVIQPIYMCRLVRYMASVVSGEQASMKVTFADWFNLFIVYVLYSLAIAIGFMALIIPGIYLAARFCFAEFEVVLKNSEPFNAMETSWHKTKPQTLPLFLGTIIIWGGNLILDILLGSAGTTGQELYFLSSIIAELITTGFMIFISIFYFRVYVLSLDSPADRSH